MTLTIKSIDYEGPEGPDRNPDAVHRFWIAAGDVFIKIARDQPDIQQLVYTVVDAGGDVEITAHNREGRISGRNHRAVSTSSSTATLREDCGRRLV